MSRTPKRGKPPGYEYWSARPGPSKAPSPGRWSKTVTHRKERLQAKKAIAGQTKENDVH